MDPGVARALRCSTVRRVAFLLAVAFVLRLVLGWWLHVDRKGQFLFGDSQTYWALARTIARGEPYQYGEHGRVFRTPGYPLLLAPLFFLMGDEPSPMAGRVLSAALGALSVVGVWWLARRLGDDRAAWLAGAMATVYPGAIALGALVLSEAPFCPLMLAQLALWTVAWQTPSVGRAGAYALGAGLLAAAASLMRPSWLLFTPFALLLGCLAGPRRARHLGLGAAILGGLALGMTPWWIRNAQVTGHFVPTTLQVGASLYDGLNPHATGASNMDFVEPLTAAAKEDFQRSPVRETECFESYLNARFRQEAWAWAQENPVRVLQLAAIKLARLWNIWPNEPRFSGWLVRAAVAVTYVPVFLLGILGAWKTIRLGWPYVLCWLPAIYLTAVHVVFVGSLRYREPAMLPLTVLAAAVIRRLDFRTAHTFTLFRIRLFSKEV